MRPSGEGELRVVRFDVGCRTLFPALINVTILSERLLCHGSVMEEQDVLTLMFPNAFDGHQVGASVASNAAVGEGAGWAGVVVQL